MGAIFAESWFFYYLILTVLAVWFVPANFRKIVLLGACVAFHAHYAGPAGMAPIILLAALTYFALNRGAAARYVMIAVCVLALLNYKYAGLINQLTGISIPISAAPLAISFFIFEFVHQLADRNRNRLANVKPLDFSLFTIFFPSLASGPIKRYQQFQPELKRLGRPSWPLVSQSLVRILFGFCKKFCFADALSREVPELGMIHYWNGSVATLALLQGLRIFLDFSGYSDIAIGFAGLLNIRLPENFSFPYLATDISEFWRRWHISLSTWVRDYIYIVLGGNRVTNLRRFANLMAAMVLCGLWHGAALHFALWGVLHGMALLTVHFWQQQRRFRMPPALGWAFTVVFVQFSWLIFFYDASDVLTLFKTSPIL